MSDYKWFQKTTWSEADQADFWNRWKKCKTTGTKAQSLRVQALSISKQYPEESLKMLDRILTDFPDSFEVALVYWQRGEILLSEGRLDESVNSLEKAFAREVERPNIKSNAWSTYGMVVVKHKLIERYDQAEKQASPRLASAAFPAERYFGHAILALIDQHRGNSARAAEHARAALAETKVRHSGFRFHPEVGIVTDPDEELLSELELIAR